MGGDGLGGRVGDALGGNLVVVDALAAVGQCLARSDRAFQQACGRFEKGSRFFEGWVRGRRHRGGSFQFSGREDAGRWLRGPFLWDRVIPRS